MARPSHAEALEILRDVHAELFPGETAELRELEIARAVAWYESNYGSGWSGAGAGSHNWGAIHAGAHVPPCPLGTFPGHDSTITGEKYAQCFRAYADDRAGARDFLRVLFAKRPSVHEAAQRGDTLGVATEIQATKYTPDRTVAHLHRALCNALKTTGATACGEGPVTPGKRIGTPTGGNPIAIVLGLALGAGLLLARGRS